MKPVIEIDSGSGFCFGVVTAINKAEEELAKSGKLYCLGDIVHNNDEVERLKQKGLITISHEDLQNLRNVKVLLRAHGEPPSTYRIAKENNIEIIDATCPVVLQLQRRIKKSYDENRASGDDSQIVIYGKKGHAEVNGLVGQTEGKAIVIEDELELNKLDYHRPITLYSQTTKSVDGFQEIVKRIGANYSNNNSFRSFDTICRQVANRVGDLKKFALNHDLVLFVCGNKSSNGKFLYTECKSVNDNSYLIGNENDLNIEWFKGKEKIGICGATSTPRWLMERIRDRVSEITSKENR
ncbi:MAG: 4-hydroxy-3-methylbut-2-enyl diphosphate reductase [Muribaculaceae bacterium]|nr:4-hydroxy-3-methylbut-2-enyl diphosphate reductase [Muribaculaceae bacterium]